MAGPLLPPGAQPGPPPPPPAPPAPGYPPYGAPPFGYPPGWSYTASTHAARLGLVSAGFGERFGAWLLDALILSAAQIPLWLVGVGFVASGWETHPGTCTDNDGRRYSCTVPTGGTVLRIVAAVGVGVVVLLIAHVLYYGRLEGERGQTIGKRVLGIRVVDERSGQPIGFGRAVGRFFARVFLSGQILGLGYFWMLWDDNDQTWHDKIVKSIVVKA